MSYRTPNRAAKTRKQKCNRGSWFTEEQRQPFLAERGNGSNSGEIRPETSDVARVEATTRFLCPFCHTPWSTLAHFYQGGCDDWLACRRVNEGFAVMHKSEVVEWEGQGRHGPRPQAKQCSAAAFTTLLAQGHPACNSNAILEAGTGWLPNTVTQVYDENNNLTTDGQFSFEHHFDALSAKLRLPPTHNDNFEGMGAIATSERPGEGYGFFAPYRVIERREQATMNKYIHSNFEEILQQAVQEGLIEFHDGHTPADVLVTAGTMYRDYRANMPANFQHTTPTAPPRP